MVVVASGCGSQPTASHLAGHHRRAPVASTPSVSIPLHSTWLMPALLPKAWFSSAMPEFCPWASNAPQPTYTFAKWRPPASWSRFLLKNEPSGGTVATISQERALFITLQGVVYLYPAYVQWPPLTYDDIPPGATIIAEYVPVARAVRAGVVPVYRLPLTEVGGLPPSALAALASHADDGAVAGSRLTSGRTPIAERRTTGGSRVRQPSLPRPGCAGRDCGPVQLLKYEGGGRRVAI